MEHSRIFMVEDDPVISGAVASHLSSWGYEVRQAQDFQRVLEECVAFDPHLVLLDIGLPVYNGYHWCRELRKVSRVPILFLTASQEDPDLITAVSMGGDDYVTKPVRLPLLTAKVQALLRRTYDFNVSEHLLSWRDGSLSPDTGTFRTPTGAVSLTKNESKILAMLLERRGQVVRRESLTARLWESGDFVDVNTLSVNVARLRKKLASVGAGDWIQTKKGVGYQIG